MATLVWGGGSGFMVRGVDVAVRWWIVLVEELGKEKGELGALAVGFCWKIVEAARVKGRPERREV